VLGNCKANIAKLHLKGSGAETPDTPTDTWQSELTAGLHLCLRLVVSIILAVSAGATVSVMLLALSYCYCHYSKTCHVSGLHGRRSAAVPLFAKPATCDKLAASQVPGVQCFNSLLRTTPADWWSALLCMLCS
jgi:hypothetical protein